MWLIYSEAGVFSQPPNRLESLFLLSNATRLYGRCPCFTNLCRGTSLLELTKCVLSDKWAQCDAAGQFRCLLVPSAPHWAQALLSNSTKHPNPLHAPALHVTLISVFTGLPSPESWWSRSLQNIQTLQRWLPSEIYCSSLHITSCRALPGWGSDPSEDATQHLTDH